MGGRMRGESPRERKSVELNCGSSVADSSQFNACGVIATAPAIVPVQASRQQRVEYWPLGQQVA